MNTIRGNNILKPKYNYVFCLEELELAFEDFVLDRITEAWESGDSIERIAWREKRDPDEIFLALFHQARERKITRPFGFRKRSAL